MAGPALHLRGAVFMSNEHADLGSDASETPAAVDNTEHGGHGTHNKHAGHDPDAFRSQFWVVLILTIPVVI